GIPNIVLKVFVNTIAPLLFKCLHAVLCLNYFPKAWQEWIAIVLRKPGRSEYTIPKSYRLIALYATMGKI
ncbi:hypothetical protein BU17DRAFT_25876, partial [Hysterangium stoloniferum]